VGGVTDVHHSASDVQSTFSFHLASKRTLCCISPDLWMTVGAHRDSEQEQANKQAVTTLARIFEFTICPFHTQTHLSRF
jgi:hypothetical protein